MKSPPSFLLVECGLSLAVFAAAVVWPNAGGRWFKAAERGLGKFAMRRGLCIGVIILSTIVLRLAVLPLIPIPQPALHDEFSYLLAADTFAHGRLTNPTPPMWRHFESFHINMRPSYMSTYFPGQGLFLAAGKVLFGDPWYGVLLSSALMCGAICWMLQGWLPPAWALLGAALAVLRVGVFSYWMNSYYGGAVAAMGGALVLGALPRLLRSPRTRDGMLMAAGIIVLANSRAYEGFLVCAPAALMLLWRYARDGRARVFLRPAALLLLGAGLSCYYNYRVFGSPLTLPYQTNRVAYAMAPIFIWMTPRPAPQYAHPVMRDFYTRWELETFNAARTARGFLHVSAVKVEDFYLFFFGVALLPAVLMMWRAAGDRRVRPLWILAVTYALGLAGSAWFYPHYAGPLAGAIYVLMIQGFRHLRRFRGFGRQLVRITLPLCVVLAGLRMGSQAMGFRIDRFPAMWYGTAPMGLCRGAVLRRLEREDGGQLAIVRYTPDHSPHDEWVYNAADIDGSKVVWARAMDAADDADLVGYYRGRTVWLVEPDAEPVRVTRRPF